MKFLTQHAAKPNHLNQGFSMEVLLFLENSTLVQTQGYIYIYILFIYLLEH
jgi:hypothetical protein